MPFHTHSIHNSCRVDMAVTIAGSVERSQGERPPAPTLQAVRPRKKAAWGEARLCVRHPREEPQFLGTLKACEWEGGSFRQWPLQAAMLESEALTCTASR